MAILDPLPRSLANLLAEEPSPGNRNIWIFTIAKRARHVASPVKVRCLLETVASRWHDRDFRPEIERAVARAFESNATDKHKDDSDLRPPWPAFDPAAWEHRKQGPILFESTPLYISAEEILDRLYVHAPQSKIRDPKSEILLCLSLDTRSAQTQPREKWRGLEAGMQFIVANPMTAPTGLNQSGRVSSRCHDNASRDRCFQVVEFDRGTLQEQAAILSSLHSQRTPLILVVWSGGKSLHGWYEVSRLSAYRKLRFFRHAVFLGADATLWDPAKLVRMPGGRRDTGTKQDVFHFNPEPVSRS